MDYITKAGIRAGAICAFMVLAGVIVLIIGWLFLPREQIIWPVMLYLGMDLFAFFLSGLISGIYTSPYVIDVKEAFKPGLVAGTVTAVVPTILSLLIIILAALGGREQAVWAMFGFGMIFFSLVKIFISALISAVYITVARKSTITIKFS